MSRDYLSARREFSVDALARAVLKGSLSQGLNASDECCDRWADKGKVALEWISRDFEREILTFDELSRRAASFAQILALRGVGRGDVVAGMLPRIPELLAVIVGTWRAGAVYQPLFTAFGPKAIESRITGATGSGAKLVVCDATNRGKLDSVDGCPPVLEVNRRWQGMDAGALDDPIGATVALRGEDPFVMIYTSGTTGNPKGVRYPLRLLLAVAEYMLDGLDLREDDRYWNAADPGWAYGMLYTVVGPLLLGRTTRMYEGPFTVDAALRVIGECAVNNLAAAPTVYRMMMAAGDDAVAGLKGRLRVASSAGEPLNPEVVRWADRVLRCPLRDHYGQTEVAMVVNNHHGLAHQIKEGSAGLSMPGFHVDVIDENLNPAPPGAPGALAVDRSRSPLCTFDGYWNASTPSLRGSWYLTGDTMTRDEDGFFFFVGRSDDVITSAAYRIGPFDVESAVMEHPAVAEVAVIGKPDPERTEIVKAFVVLRPGKEPSDALAGEIQQRVRERVGAHAYPREVEFVSDLPKTPSGKVQRYLLRQRG